MSLLPPPQQGEWLKFGFILSIYYLIVWAGSALTWWRAIGIW
jgi:di/tricarboxylate transporter